MKAKLVTNLSFDELIFLLDGEMLGEDGGLYCKPEDPVLVVVEAKRTATLNITASEAEVLGQIRTLMQKRYIVIIDFADVEGEMPLQ